MTNKQKEEFAEWLVIRTSATKKEIAQRVGVTPKTMGRWWDKNNWEQKRTSFFITKGQELQRIYIQISTLNNEIAERPKKWAELKEKYPEDKNIPNEAPKGYASPREADTLSKLTASARSLETEVSLADIIDVAIKFTDWMREVDFEKSKEISDYFDSFIKDSNK